MYRLPQRQRPLHVNIDTGAQRTILTTKAGEFFDPNAPRESITLVSGAGSLNLLAIAHKPRDSTWFHLFSKSYRRCVRPHFFCGA